MRQDWVCSEWYGRKLLMYFKNLVLFSPCLVYMSIFHDLFLSSFNYALIHSVNNRCPLYIKHCSRHRGKNNKQK